MDHTLIPSFDEFKLNEAKNFIASLSIEQIRTVGEILLDWQTDTENFKRSRINTVFDILSGSKYTKNNELYRILYFNDEIIKDGKIDKNVVLSKIKKDNSYYSFTKNLRDLAYVVWRWTDNKRYFSTKGKYGIVITQKAKKSIDITEFIEDTYNYLHENYKEEEDLIYVYQLGVMQADEGETEVISHTNSFKIAGILTYDPNNLYDHSKSTKIVNSWDDFEKDADIYFYTLEDFSL